MALGPISNLSVMAGQVPDIPGVKAPDHGAQAVLRHVAQILNRKQPTFPGAQPVSFTRRHLTDTLLNHDYFVCEKSDGLRCLLFLVAEGGEEKCYMLTRKNEVYFIPDFHVPLNPKDPGSFHAQGSLIDGELVLTSSGKMQFLMFDMIACNGKVVADRTLDKRLGYLKEMVYKPFSELCRQFPDDTRIFPFTLKMKTMELSYGLVKALEEKLDHVSDGLIFTSRDAPYVYGTDKNILKWKPADENSVDFVSKLNFSLYKDPSSGEEWFDYDSAPEWQLLAWHGGDNDRPYGKMHLEAGEWDKLKALGEPLDDRVVECYMDDEKRWRYLRFRDDKDHGNHINVVESVIESITDRVTQEDLMGECPAIRSAWHERESAKLKRQRGE